MNDHSNLLSAKPWKVANLPSLVPDQSGRRVLITGANSGIGYPAARELARAGATVVLAVRNSARGETALARLRSEVPGAQLELGILDLASLASVREFAARESDRGLALDLLIDNAGVMAPPKRLKRGTDSSCSLAPMCLAISPSQDF